MVQQWCLIHTLILFIATVSLLRPLSSPISSEANRTSSLANVFDAVRTRRTIYQLSSDTHISDSTIEEIIGEAVLHVPSSFNSQSARAVLLIEKEHQKLWCDRIKPVMKSITAAEQRPASERRLDMFQTVYGTVLFYEDLTVIASLQESMPAYADKFPPWIEHTNVMHHSTVWTALAQAGSGANLQHYTAADEKIASTWSVPLTWSLKAQLVLGSAGGKPVEKIFQPLENRCFMHSKDD